MRFDRSILTSLGMVSGLFLATNMSGSDAAGLVRLGLASALQPASARQTTLTSGVTRAEFSSIGALARFGRAASEHPSKINAEPCRGCPSGKRLSLLPAVTRISRISRTKVERVGRSVYADVYRATLSNPGAAAQGVIVTVSLRSPGTAVADGMLLFGDVSAHATARSVDTFTLIHDKRAAKVNESSIRFSVQAHDLAPVLLTHIADDVLPTVRSGLPFTLNVSRYFRRVSGQSLHYALRSSLNGKPDGRLTINAETGVVSGVITSREGVLSVTVTASNPQASTSDTFTLRIGTPPSTAGATEVGIIPDKAGVCPVGSDYVWVYNDDEDKKNANSVSGWIGATLSNAGNTGTRFGFCRVSGSFFEPDPVLPYAVLQLSDLCPFGSYSVARQFDNENHNPQSSVSSNFSGPALSATGPDNTLYFCYFIPGQVSLNPPGFPQLTITYGVFAPTNAQAFPTYPTPLGSGGAYYTTGPATGSAPATNYSQSTLAGGSVYTDEEDDSNDDTYNFNGTKGGQTFTGTKNSNDMPFTGFATWITGQKNTTIAMAKVSTAAMDCSGKASWWDGTLVAAQFDGANCFVKPAPPASTPFIYQNRYYIASTRSCPPGTTPLGANCFYRFAPLGGYISGNVFYSANGTQLAAAPPGTTAFAQHLPLGPTLWFMTPQLSCPSGGNFDTANCRMGSPPAATGAFVYAHKFYYHKP